MIAAIAMNGNKIGSKLHNPVLIEKPDATKTELVMYNPSAAKIAVSIPAKAKPTALATFYPPFKFFSLLNNICFKFLIRIKENFSLKRD
jgi:hypothetical protein